MKATPACKHTHTSLVPSSKSHLLNFFSQRESFSPSLHSFLGSPLHWEKNQLSQAHLIRAPLHQQYVCPVISIYNILMDMPQCSQLKHEEGCVALL